MNINNFKAKLKGGGARSNLYEVTGAFPAAAAAIAAIPLNGNVTAISNPADDIRFMVSAASLPAVELGVVQAPFQGRILKLAGDRSFREWTITVYNDTNFSLRNAFEKWSDICNKIESNTGPNGLAAYVQDWKVTQKDRNGNDIKTYRFVDCWPSSVSAISLSYDQTTSIESFTVDLQFQYFEAQGTST